MISKGATTIWERWDTDTQDGGMNGESQKILSGTFEAWCYQTLAGINYDREQPGFKHIILKPQPVGDLASARGTYKSPYGLIESDWKVTNDQMNWHFTVPPNTTATVYLPTDAAESTTESGKPIATTGAIRTLRQDANAVVLSVGSGKYQFACHCKRP